MQMMSSKHMPISQERMNFLMEGVLFLVKSQKSPIFSEESEEIPCVGLDHDGFDASTPLVGIFCRGLFYYKSINTSSAVGTHRD